MRDSMDSPRNQPTTKAQRPGAQEATIAAATLPPGSLKRMILN
jgi:hypothetical protein